MASRNLADEIDAMLIVDDVRAGFLALSPAKPFVAESGRRCRS